MLINVDNATLGYGSKVVLQDVSLSVTSGGVGLLGPNGAGKSTLLKTLLGFIPQLSGRVEIMGLPVMEHIREVRSLIGYVPEVEALLPGMNAVNFVTYMGELAGLPANAARERAHEVLHYVGLGEARYRNLDTYSMGMKQRAKLAQAIVHDPKILLLDEPTNGMDPSGRLEMLELVSDLVQNKGICVILCSHLLKDVESVAQEIIVLGNGQVVNRRLHDPDSVGEDEERIYGVRVKGDFAALQLELEKVGILPVPDQLPAYTTLMILPAGSSPHLFFEAAKKTNCLIQRLEHKKRGLEEVFTEAVQELGGGRI